MSKLVIVAMFGLGVVGISSSAALAADAGKAVFEKSCVSCHGADGKGNSAMAKMFGEKELNIVDKETTAKKDDALLKVIAEGAGKMPAQKTLSKDEQKQVLGYVRSLAK
ncbi:MAG: c-type cytochrome [Deltaproteobacteria bacterium]|nr:c-type cytochrome [Deltaproteobacteria bacterium]